MNILCDTKVNFKNWIQVKVSKLPPVGKIIYSHILNFYLHFAINII